MDEERRTLFSFSGYQGDQDVLCEVWGNSFHLQRRRFWRTDFAHNFYGELQPEAGGTRIQGRFQMAAFAQFFMWVWLSGAVLIGGAVFVSSLSAFLTSGQGADEEWRGLIAPPALLLFGIVFFGCGHLSRRDDETFILEHLQNVLSARIDMPA